MAIKAEIVAIGTELLLGQITNTNGQWISEKLATKGIGVYFHQVVGDNKARIKSSLRQALDRSELIFITGGLGPTDDDLTREIVAELVERELIENDDILTQLKQYFDQSNRVMSENNYKQAQIIAGAEIIPNPIGTAPGMMVEYQSSLLILMPGVPSEMKYMMTEYVLPYLEKNYQLKEVIVSKMLRCVGIGEAQLETKDKSLIEQQSNPTIAPLAADGEVALRLTALANSKAEANRLIDAKEKELHALIGSYIYGSDEQTLAEVIVDRLKDKNETISSAESFTGGKFADQIVSIPGSSRIFNGSLISYTKDAKINALGLDRSTIDQYGMVSKQTAYEMAKRAQVMFNSDYGISFTGVAGPDRLEGQPVGTVFVCLYHSDRDFLIEKFHFSNRRNSIRTLSVKKGLEMIYKYLK